MTILLLFMALLMLSMAVALTDWRRGWMLAILCGVLQDPVRKLTPGTPVYLTMSVIAVYLAVLIGAQSVLQQQARELARRFSSLKVVAALVFLMMVLAAFNGLITFGLENWKAPALALFVYCAPIPAVIVGYTYLRREEQMYRFFQFYAIVTSVAMIGTVLEYFDVRWRALGTVALTEAFNLRYLPGLEIRLLSGFYRGPDIMGWHAATLTMIGLAMTLRARVLNRAWPWLLVSGWGFLNALISGRRKALYMVAVFAAAFLLRYVRRLTVSQVASLLIAAAVLGFVVHRVQQDEAASVYARGAGTTSSEVFDRLEGGLIGTIEQFGFMGAGLGTATQGVYHVLESNNTTQLGWQEGGLGKLMMELGLPGLGAVALFGVTFLLLMFRITSVPDIAGSSQFIRATLFGIILANVVEFFVSAQAYSDAVLTLMTAFFVGCFLATAMLDERLAEEPEPASRGFRARAVLPA